MQLGLTVTVLAAKDTIHTIDRATLWRSHQDPTKRALLGSFDATTRVWRGTWCADDLQEDTSVYLDVYATGPDETRYHFATAYAWASELLSGAERTSELVNVYTDPTARNRLGTAVFASVRAAVPIPAAVALSLRQPSAFRALKAECVRLSAARTMDGPAEPEMRRLYIDQFDNSTQFPLPVCMFFRMAKPDGRDIGPVLARYLDSAILCRGWSDAVFVRGLERRDPEALDVLCDALCCVAYTIPYQTDYAPVGGRDLVLEVDAYEDPLQTGRGDCEDFALLIMRLVLFAQRAWTPDAARDRAVRDLLRCYVAAATMRTVNAPSMGGARTELSGHMNVALYPRGWFNRASDVRVDGPVAKDDARLPTLYLEGTGSMWGPLTVETPSSVPRARPEAIRNGWRGRMFHSQAPIDRATDPFGFMRHAGLLWVPDAPPGREQMHMCTVREGNTLFGASLEDEVQRVPAVCIRGAPPTPDETLALMARAETHLPPLVDLRCVPSVSSPVVDAARRLPGWRPVEEARGRRVLHFFGSTETTGTLDFLRGRQFTAFAEQLAPRVARVNILVFQ